MTRFTYWSPRTVAGMVLDFLYSAVLGMVLVLRFYNETTPVPFAVIVTIAIMFVVIRLLANIWAACSYIEVGETEIAFFGLEKPFAMRQFLTSIDRLVLRPMAFGLFPPRHEVWFKNGKKLGITSKIRDHKRLISLLEEQTGKTFSIPGKAAEVSAS